MIRASHDLKTYRFKRGLFQRDVAKGVGILPTTYSLIETGRRTTTCKTAKKIADFLDVPLEDAFVFETEGGKAV